MKFRKAHFRDWISAILITLGVLAGLGWLFRYQPPPKAPENTSRPRVVLITERGLGSARWKNFARFLAWHDPRLSLRGDSRVGFAAGNADAGRIAWPITLDSPAVSTPRWEAPPLPPLVVRQVPQPAPSDWRNFPALPPEIVKIFVGSRRPLPAGAFFGNIPPGGGGRTVIRVSAGYGVNETPGEMATVADATLPMPLFQVVKSCGNADLDRYALRELSRMNLPPVEDEISIVWPRATGRN